MMNFVNVDEDVETEGNFNDNQILEIVLTQQMMKTKTKITKKNLNHCEYKTH